MIENAKSVESLVVADLEAHSVWKYANRDGSGELLIRPIKKIPVRDLSGKLVATKVRFSNGDQSWALIGNVDVSNPRLTEHFLTLSIEHEGKWFSLARYHDYDYEERGPEALSKFLCMNVDDIFPIAFDIRQCAEGDSSALKGSVPKEPRERLSRAEITAMAVP